MFYVYVIQSTKDGSLYKGFSEDYLKRLEAHNNGESKYTSTKMPWKLLYVEVHVTKREALIRERKLKKANNKYIQWLVQQDSNILRP
ncbi:MAG: GIY-YIG nuclease family protein [Chitinophagales bacterium]|nr:GIY-YIG nuclease family protein [Chitinophagales bacterium]